MNRLRSHPAFLNARAALAALSGNCDQGDGKLRRVEKARVDDDIEELIARVSGKLGVTVEDFMRANAYALDLRRRFDAHRLAKNAKAKNRRKKWKRELSVFFSIFLIKSRKSLPKIEHRDGSGDGSASSSRRQHGNFGEMMSLR